MKNVKKLAFVLVLSLLASCFFGISAFAEDKAVEKNYFEINTDILYAKIPDDFDFEPYDTMNFYDKVHELVRYLKATNEYKKYVELKEKVKQDKNEFALHKVYFCCDEKCENESFTSHIITFLYLITELSMR